MRKTGTELLWIVGASVMLVICSPAASHAQQPGGPPLSRDDLPPFPTREFDPPDWAPIPADLAISIVREDVIPGQFRILDVTLSHEIDEPTLTVLANLLRDGDDMTYLRTYIVYYLPGMTPGERGWATSHFLPELEVRIVPPDSAQAL